MDEKEVIKRIQDGDKGLANQFFEDNKDLFKWFVSKYKNYGIELDELEGIIYEQMWRSLIDFDVRRDVKYNTLAGVYVDRAMVTAIRKITAKKRKANVMSLYTPISESENDTIECIVKDDESLDGYFLIEDSFWADSLKDKLSPHLTISELEVLEEVVLNGKTVRETAKKLNKTYQRISVIKNNVIKKILQNKDLLGDFIGGERYVSAS